MSKNYPFLIKSLCSQSLKRGLWFIFFITLFMTASQALNPRDRAARAFQVRMDSIQSESNRAEGPVSLDSRPSLPPASLKNKVAPQENLEVPQPELSLDQKINELTQDMGSVMLRLDRLERKLNHLSQEHKALHPKKKVKKSSSKKHKRQIKHKKQKKA